MKKYIMIGGAVMAIVLVVVVIQSFQINSLKKQLTGNVIAANAGISTTGISTINTAGWTEDEKMMYEHHGTLPARVQGSSQQGSQQGQMVGGC